MVNTYTNQLSLEEPGKVHVTCQLCRERGGRGGEREERALGGEYVH